MMRGTQPNQPPAANRSAPGRKPRSAALILSQGMVFACIAVLIAVLSYRVMLGDGPAAPVTAGSADTIPWQTDLSAALARAKASGKPVLVDFSAKWCPPCQQMKRDGWSDPRVGAAVVRDYIPVLMDADDPRSTGPGNRYGIETIPAILVLDSGGNVLRRAAFMTKDELIAFLTAKPR